MTVLVVDDEVVIVETLCEVLETVGYQAVSARNGREGLKVFEEAKPDAVVSDVMMPQLDGREMVRAIRATEHGRNIPIILISAARDIARGGDIGHDLFLEKPFDLEDFLAHVEKLTRRD
jgi:DNA-binding response OmpR family regulator